MPLTEVAAQGSEALLDTRGWLHRRVDNLSYTSREMIRREISVDFSIPPGYPHFRAAPEGSDVATYFVPIFLLRKWPPLIRLDLRSEEGHPIPLLTSTRNREVDAAALMALPPPGALRDELRADLEAVALRARRAATDALDRVASRIDAGYLTLDEDEQHRWLQVLLLASKLVGNSILWARVDAYAAQRQIVKVAFEYPSEKELVLSRRVLTALSWAPSRTHIEIPSIGEGSTYHLQFEPPPGLTVHRSLLKLGPPPDLHAAAVAPQPAARGFRKWIRGLWWALRNTCRAKWGEMAGQRKAPSEVASRPEEVEPSPGEAYRWTTPSRAYLYVAGPRPAFGLAEVDMAVDNRSLVNGAVVTALAIAGLLTVLTASASGVADHVAEAVTTLLLVPGLLGYLVVRPGEHPLVRPHLSGVRALILCSGAMPVLAAVSLVTGPESPTGSQVCTPFLALTVVAWLVAAMLILSWLLPPVKERYRSR